MKRGQRKLGARVAYGDRDAKPQFPAAQRQEFLLRYLAGQFTTKNMPVGWWPWYPQREQDIKELLAAGKLKAWRTPMSLRYRHKAGRPNGSGSRRFNGVSVVPAHIPPLPKPPRVPQPYAKRKLWKEDLQPS